MKYIPIFQIFLTFACAFTDLTDNVYLFLSNFFGFSIFTSLFFIVYLKNEKKYLLYSAHSLLIISIYNTIGIFINYEIYDKYFLILLLIIYFTTSYYASKNTTRNRK